MHYLILWSLAATGREKNVLKIVRRLYITEMYLYVQDILFKKHFCFTFDVNTSICNEDMCQQQEERFYILCDLDLNIVSPFIPDKGNHPN